MRRSTRAIVKAAHAKQPYAYRLLKGYCDFCMRGARHTLYADQQADAACCPLHIGAAVVAVTGRNPDAVLEVAPFKPHEAIR